MVGGGPADEGPSLTVAGGMSAGQPGVQVGLGGAVKGQAAGLQVIEQGQGGPDALLDGDGLAATGLVGADAPAQSADQVPGAVAVQQVLLVGVGTRGGCRVVRRGFRG